MTNKPSVSVIIPAFNAAERLPAAVRSAINQYPVTEVIIVNNNSYDETVTVAEALAKDYPQKMKLIHQKNQGSAAARNLGVKVARGELIQFLDADDILLPGKIPRQLSFFEQDEGLDFVMGAWLYEFADKKRSKVVPDQNLWIGLLSGKIGNTNANLYRKKVLLEIGGQNESLLVGQDVDMLFRLAKASCSYAVDPVPGSIYFLHEGFHMSQSENISERLIRRIDRDLDVVRFVIDNHQSRYLKNGKQIRSLLLRKIRHLATFDLKSADEFYQKYLDTVKSQRSVYCNMVSFLVVLYPLFGFGATEKMRILLGRWRRAFLPNANKQ